jgi:hypothetical protein
MVAYLEVIVVRIDMSAQLRIILAVVFSLVLVFGAKIAFDINNDEKAKAIQKLLASDLKTIASKIEIMEQTNRPISIDDIKEVELSLVPGAKLEDFQIHPYAQLGNPLVEYVGSKSDPYIQIWWREGFSTQRKRINKAKTDVTEPFSKK